MWRWSGPTSLIAGTFVLFDSGWEPEDPGACCEDRQAAAIGRPIPSGVGLLVPRRAVDDTGATLRTSKPKARPPVG